MPTSFAFNYDLEIEKDAPNPCELAVDLKAKGAGSATLGKPKGK